jgi:uncharacterized protein (DUF1800 family)
MPHQHDRLALNVANAARRVAQGFRRGVLLAAALTWILVASAAVQAQDASPVYRFYNNVTGTHFYTISATERDTVVQRYPQFIFEGAVYWAYTAQSGDTMPVYRFYNNRTNTHFYTQSEQEKQFIIANYPVFVYEGPAYYAPPAGGTGRGPLYRFYNTRTGAHFFTASASERDNVQKSYPWFAYEGTAYYIYNTGSPPNNGGNAVPKASLTAAPGATPGVVVLSASATDPDGYVAAVDFYMDGNKIGTVETAPFTMNYTLPTLAAHGFTAVAIDNLGASGPSDVVVYTPGGVAPNLAPKATLVATPGATPGAVVLAATATDTDGIVAAVDFYMDGGKIGTVLAAPYTLNYTLPTLVAHGFTAVAIDNLGATGTSPVVTYTPGAPPNVAPKVTLAASATAVAVGQVVTLTAAPTDQDGTIAKVDFYQGGTLLGTKAAAPYTYAYTAAAAGNLSFTATATDDKLATGTSSPVAVTVTAGPPTNQAPKVSLALSTTLTQVPAVVTLTATATDADGTISKVDFYQDGNLVATKAASPYTFQVNLSNAGTYAFFVQATDNQGATATTLSQNVIGTLQPPVVAASADVWRLLNQATFGPTAADITSVSALGISNWVDAQFTQPISGYPDVKYNRIQLKETPDCTTKDPLGNSYPANSPQAQCVRDHLTLNMLQRDFFTNAATAPDQLRQRVAWALSQILVTSGNEQELSYAHVMSRYQQIFFEEAFGNYENILRRVSLSPAMGNYLDMVNNDRAAGTRVPNENYAREIQQLFSVGLEELKVDGTPLLDAQNQPIATYDQTDIAEFARVFTGWTYANADGTPPTKKNGSFYGAPMQPFPGTATSGHDPTAKTLLNGQILPANQTIQQDLLDAVHNVFMHPNTGPFVAKQLIQKLVTGNPSPAYVQRVATVFNNNGQGVRGDLKAVVKAILLDTDARGAVKTDPTFGSLREPVLVVSALIRSLGGITDGNTLAARTGALGQNPYFSPTVFNYFQPDQTISGTSVLAPEFGIHNSNSAVARANLVYTLVYTPIAPDANIPSAVGTKLNTQQFEAVADNPAAMCDQINTVLMGGTFPAYARDVVVTAVNAIAQNANPAVTQWRTDRARMAVYLMASSYHYQVQH